MSHALAKKGPVKNHNRKATAMAIFNPGDKVQKKNENESPCFPTYELVKYQSLGLLKDISLIWIHKIDFVKQPTESFCRMDL